MKCVIFDIDGTLANIEHRVHHVRGDHKDWRKFYAEISYDAPRPEVIRLINFYATEGDYVFICTGRPEETREATEKWLEENGVYHYNELLMRPDGDYRKDSIVKKEMLDYIRNNGYDIEVVYDDRQQVVDMWRENDVTVFQVAPGDFDDRAKYKSGELVLLVGPSGAGKSTFAREFAHSHVVLSSDHFRQVISGDIKDQSINDQVFVALHAATKSLIRNGVSVCIDATNLRDRDRKAFLSLVPETCKVKYYLIDRPIEDKIKTGGWRNEVIIKGKTLIQKHDELFKSNMKAILSGDKDSRVVVIDARNVNG
jgi:predicted kinase